MMVEIGFWDAVLFGAAWGFASSLTSAAITAIRRPKQTTVIHVNPMQKEATDEWTRGPHVPIPGAWL